MATAKPTNATVYPVTSAEAAPKVASTGELEVKRRLLADEYRNGTKVTISGSPFYRPYFGMVMPIIINGIAIHVPMDGNSYEVPEAFADVFHERIRRVDALVKTQNEMSDVGNNFEAYAGEMSLIKSV